MGRIIKYVPMREDRIITGFELCSAVIISLMLGWIFAGWFSVAVDVYECQFAIGWDAMINWRAE